MKNSGCPTLAHEAYCAENREKNTCARKLMNIHEKLGNKVHVFFTISTFFGINEFFISHSHTQKLAYPLLLASCINSSLARCICRKRPMGGDAQNYFTVFTQSLWCKQNGFKVTDERVLVKTDENVFLFCFGNDFKAF